jgi:hypothetical protein
MASKVCDASVVPRVGIGCFVQDARGRVLLGKRFGSHGSGTLVSHPKFVTSIARHHLTSFCFTGPAGRSLGAT